MASPLALLPVAHGYGRSWLSPAVYGMPYETVREVLAAGPDWVGRLYGEAFWECYDLGYRHRAARYEVWRGGSRRAQ